MPRISKYLKGHAEYFDLIEDLLARTREIAPV